jgi:hypothetical protein
MREEDLAITRDGIAVLPARMDQVEAGWLSPEDDAVRRASLHARKASGKSQFSEDADKPQRI